jgi:hypothetical protein
MIETKQGCSCRHVDSQAAKEFLAKIWLELLDWGAIAFNSAGRLLTALVNFFMLAIAVLIAALAAVVLIVREQITEPSEASTVSLISLKSLFKRTRASVSD